MALIVRGTTFYLRKRVPTRYHPVEDRREILHSLHTDSRQVAERKAGVVWAELIESWEARVGGDTQDAEQRYDAARNFAKVRGLPNGMLSPIAFEQQQKLKLQGV
jgi:hypothetical protein